MKIVTKEETFDIDIEPVMVRFDSVEERTAVARLLLAMGGENLNCCFYPEEDYTREEIEGWMQSKISTTPSN